MKKNGSLLWKPFFEWSVLVKNCSIIQFENLICRQIVKYFNMFQNWLILYIYYYLHIYHFNWFLMKDLKFLNRALSLWVWNRKISPYHSKTFQKPYKSKYRCATNAIFHIADKSSIFFIAAPIIFMTTPQHCEPSKAKQKRRS